MDEYTEYLEEEEDRPRDSKIDEAKEFLLANYFKADPKRVFYGRQLEVAVETEFFHWITKKALGELAAEREIAFAAEKQPQYELHFYWSRSNRYPKRQINQTVKLVAQFSDPVFTYALGKHGENLAEIAFARYGFLPKAKDVRAFNGKEWTSTSHNLDRLFERDGASYGVEIKNTLGYIDRREFAIKLKMCDYLGLVPVFVARMMPANYLNEVNQAGGFCLLLKYQIYPLGFEALAKEVRAKLGLFVDCRSELTDTTVLRFEKWYKKRLGIM